MGIIKKIIKKILLYINIIRIVPSAIGIFLTGESETIKKDARRWAEICKWKEKSDFYILLKLIASYREFRNMYYYRLESGGSLARVLLYIMRLIYRPEPSLRIMVHNLGTGLFIQHGFGTMIAAESVGDNCWINQQVTVGYKDDTGCLTIGNNVYITCGAKVLGKITLGDNVKGGANAVIVKDVPSNCTVVGVPGYIVKRDGKKVHEPLV